MSDARDREASSLAEQVAMAMQAQLNRMETAITKQSEKLDHIDTVLRGNGEDVVGHATRLDRLERSEEGRRKAAWIAIGAAITSGVGAVVAWLKGGGT